MFMNVLASFERQWFRLAIVVAVTIAGDARAAADDAWLKPIEAAYSRLDAKLNNFTVQASFFNKDDPPGKPPGERQLLFSYEFSRLGDSVRTVQKGSAASDRTMHSVANDSYFFMIGKKSSNEPVDLVDMGERSQLSFSNVSQRPAVKTLLSAATGPMGNYGFPLESTVAVLRLNAPRLQAQETMLEGRKVLLLEGDFERFTESATMSPQDLRAYSAPNSRIFLDPSLDHRIVRWEMKLIDKGKTYDYTDTYEYDHVVDGLALLSKFTSQIGSPVPYSTQEIEFSNWRLNVNKADEFRLSHYGLKEPKYGSKPFLSGWVWLVIVGAALVSIGGWLYRRSSASVR